MSGDHNMHQRPKAEPAPGYCKHCKQYTIEEPLLAKQEPAAWAMPRLSANEILNLMPESIPADHDGALMDFARAVEAAIWSKT